MFMTVRGKLVTPREVIENDKYTQYEKKKALKYEKILLDVTMEEWDRGHKHGTEY